MLRAKTLLVLVSVSAFGDLLNPVIPPGLFTTTQFATGVSYPEGMVQLPDGSIAVETSPGYDSSPGQLLRFVDLNGVAGTPTVLYTSVNPGIMTQIVPIGKYYAVGNFGDDTITLLAPGAEPVDPWTAVAVIQFSFAPGWEHSSAGLAARPTPGQPGSWDLVMNVGAEFDNTASIDKVGISGTGFSSFPASTITADSLYMITIDETADQPKASNLIPVATGIRNSFGMRFQPGTGDFYFSDNAEDYPEDVNGFPPQADELNFISAAQFGNGAPPNFGFPNCYIQYITGTPIGTGCVQPLLAFQPIPDTVQGGRTQGATEVAFSPVGFPAPYNRGIFTGFTGDGGLGDTTAGLVFYDLNARTYFQFIQSGNPAIADLLGLLPTANALYVSDPGTGIIYKITATTQAGQVAVTIGSNLAGAQFELEDGSTFAAPQTFSWTPGAQHTVQWLPSVSGRSDVQYALKSWLDGSALNPRTIVTPSSNTTYLATLGMQYRLTISASPSAGGIVTPTGGGFYDAGVTVPITAVPNLGYTFGGWTGSVANGANASTSVTMDSAQAAVANFAVSNAPAIAPGGIVPLNSSVNTIQPGSWISIFGVNLASAPAQWMGDFPTMLGDTSVTINGRFGYLSYVSSGQINVQAPDDPTLGPVGVTVTTPTGSAKSTVTLAEFGPSLNLFDARHAAAVIPTPDGTGAYGGGAYDLVGPAGQFAFATRPVRVGEVLELYGVGFGPTDPTVFAGQGFSGAASTTNTVSVTIGGAPAQVSFSGLSGPGLYQINVVVPQTGSGDQLVEAKVGDAQTPSGIYVTVQ